MPADWRRFRIFFTQLRMQFEVLLSRATQDLFFELLDPALKLARSRPGEWFQNVGISQKGD
jgi:hypothetical protein